MNVKKYSVTALPVIILLVSSGLVIQHSLNPGTTTTFTMTRAITETETQYVTRMQTVQATSTLYVPNHSSKIYIVPSTFTTEVTTTTTVTRNQSIVQTVDHPKNIILVGGQNGTWFTKSQYPRLFQVSLDSNSSVGLNPITGPGTVWSGISNGSDWLISGWGRQNYSRAPDPYLYLYNGTSSIGDIIDDSSEAEWQGGDVFAISSNGTSWLLSGMGSGVLSPSDSGTDSIPTNHLSVGFFDGKKFTDLSPQLSEQMDGILYANAYNGSDWLIGGGYLDQGVLFEFDGTRFIDLTTIIGTFVHSFNSVQSIAWNGHYWLIGGIGFLAKFDRSGFTDLTSNLTRSLSPQITSAILFAVNSMAWNGSSWLIGGGEPIAVNFSPSFAWLATYNSTSFVDLSSILPQYSTGVNPESSILSIVNSPTNGYWLIGGYSGNNGMLLEYQGNVTDLSSLTGDMTYVNWVAST